MKLKSLKFIFKPRFWIRNFYTNETLSWFINDSLDKGLKIKFKSTCTCELNGKILWVANYPYAFGTIEGVEGMPDRLTVERLYKEVQKQIFLE